MKGSTLLVDADAEGGGLAALLDIAPADPIAAIGGAAVAIHLEKRLWFVELGQHTAGVLNGLDWTTDERHHFDAVVIDLGHSVGPLQEQLSAASDWLLWVVVPDRSGLQRADTALASGALGAANVGIVFNRIHQGCLDGAEAALSQRHHISVMGRINEDQRIAKRLARGLPANDLWGLRRPLRDLVRSIRADAGSSVPALL
jgi:MinD-like ATPase involved in chromosome partitioning or flagellar assembly